MNQKCKINALLSAWKSTVLHEDNPPKTPTKSTVEDLLGELKSACRGQCC